MRRALIVSGLTLGGYALGAICGYAMVQYLSPNGHDRAVEAAMTALFAMGPVGAALGAIAGFVLTRRQTDASEYDRDQP